MLCWIRGKRYHFLCSAPQSLSISHTSVFIEPSLDGEGGPPKREIYHIVHLATEARVRRGRLFRLQHGPVPVVGSEGGTSQEGQGDVYTLLCGGRIRYQDETHTHTHTPTYLSKLSLSLSFLASSAVPFLGIESQHNNKRHNNHHHNNNRRINKEDPR